MAYLVDTSVLGRLADISDPLHSTAASSVLILHRRGELLYTSAQNLIEFHCIATRPRSVNGLGLSAVEAVAKSAAFEAAFPILMDTPGVYVEWKSVVTRVGVIGKQVHDARLVAFCQVHAVTHILTFNVRHFSTLTVGLRGISVVSPVEVTAS